MVASRSDLADDVVQEEAVQRERLFVHHVSYRRLVVSQAATVVAAPALRDGRFLSADGQAGIRRDGEGKRGVEGQLRWRVS